MQLRPPVLTRVTGSSRTSWPGLALWAATLLLAVSATALLALSPGAALPGAWGFRGFQVPLAVVYASVGALIVSRRPENRIGWLLLVCGLLYGVCGVCDEYFLYARFVGRGDELLAQLAYWLSDWLWVPAAAPTWSVLLLLFPNGQLLSPRWRPAYWLAGVGIASFSLVFAFGPTALTRTDTLFSVEGYNSLFSPVFFASFGAIIASSLAGAASLALRLRRASTVERQQIKWFVFAAGVLALSLPTASLPSFGVASLENLVVITSLGIPAATAIAILRHRLFDIDIIIRRTVVYALLTALLLVVYVGCVVVLQALFVGLTGQTSALAVVAATLAAAALFRPLRLALQQLIDRRFFRTKYDARLVLEGFAARAKDQTDLDALAADMLATVETTLQPECARLWLRQGDQ